MLSGNTAQAPPMSVPTMLEKTANKYPDKTALAVKRSDEWVEWSYKRYLEDARTVAKGPSIYGVCVVRGGGLPKADVVREVA